ncbi:MAG: Gfo/Idh/MocA family protein [Candidatus Hodarchaeales archaeon]
MKSVNVGIIGLGNMGLLHMYNCLHMDDVVVGAVADSSKRALKKADILRSAPHYTDYRELIDKSDGLDSVVISLPNFLHFDCVARSLEADLDVFVEKPLATTVSESKDIVKMVEKTGRKLMIGFSMRFVEAIEKMKIGLDEGRIGSLEIITGESLQNGPLSHGRVPKPVSEWWFDPEKSGGGALLDLGSHLIDLFHFFAGDSKVLFSYLDHKYNLPVEDGATLVLRSRRSSVRGVINVGWFQKSIFPKFNFRFILHGNAGYMSSEDLIPKNLYTHAFKEGIKNFSRRITGKKIRPLSYTYYYESYYRELRDFFDGIKNDLDPSSSAIDGLKTMEVIEEAYNKFDEG